MKANFLVVALLVVVSNCAQQKASAQFYPDSLANWCLHNNVSPFPGAPGFDVVMHMLNDPDTIINGLLYKRVDEILFPDSWPTCFPRYYVRSGSDGKGYTYIPSLNMEYMTGDLNAGVSDTIHNVLIADGTLSCGSQIQECPYSNLVLADVVVLSIDTISNAGVTVVRHSVWPLCSDTAIPVFWQAGIGTQHGPIMVSTNGLAYLSLERASVGDTCYYNNSTLPQGLPGGPACCVLVIENGVGEIIEDEGTFTLRPNPAHEQVTFEFDPAPHRVNLSLSVHDALGREVYRQRLSRQQDQVVWDTRTIAPGTYTVSIHDGEKKLKTEKLIIQR